MWMVRFTSGVTLPLAVITVGTSRLSAVTSLNNSGCSTVYRLGSTLTSVFVGAALVSLEQELAIIATTSSPQSAAKCLPVVFLMAPPRALPPCSIGPPPSNKSRLDLRNSVAHLGIRSVRLGNPAEKLRRSDKQRRLCRALGQIALSRSLCMDAAREGCWRGWRRRSRRH